MTDSVRDGGFLRPKERALLAEENYRLPVDVDPPASEQSEKTTNRRIDNEVASVSAFHQLIEDIRVDLATIRRREYDTDRQQLQITAQIAEDELKRLRGEIDKWLERANDEEVLKAEAELSQAWRRLYDDLSYVPGGAPSGEHAPPTEKLDEEFQEQQKRKDGLVTVLRRKNWLEVLDYIDKNGECELPDEPYEEGGWTWNRIGSELATMDLVNQDNTWGDSGNSPEFKITERGKAVLRAYRALKDTSQIKMAQQTRPDTETNDVILEVLTEYFDNIDK